MFNETIESKREEIRKERKEWKREYKKRKRMKGDNESRYVKDVRKRGGGNVSRVKGGKMKIELITGQVGHKLTLNTYIYIT